MKLLGRDISPETLLREIATRLQERGLKESAEAAPIRMDGAEPRVDPMAFNLEALERHADPTRGLPLETHRAGLGGKAVVVAKKVFRATCQVFINEALARQHVFNGHVRDSYAQLSAEVKALRALVERQQPAPARKTERKPVKKK